MNTFSPTSLETDAAAVRGEGRCEQSRYLFRSGSAPTAGWRRDPTRVYLGEWVGLLEFFTGEWEGAAFRARVTEKQLYQKPNTAHSMQHMACGAWRTAHSTGGHSEKLHVGSSLQELQAAEWLENIHS